MRALIPRDPSAGLSLSCILAACLATACSGPATHGSASNDPAPGTLAVVLGYPGPATGTLRALVGEFEVECLWWPTAGSNPIASRGMLHAAWDTAAGVVVGEFEGAPPSGFFPSRMRTGWDAARGCYVSDWLSGSGEVLLPLSDGHAQSDGEIVFPRGMAAGSSIQILTVLGEDEHLIELSHRAGGPAADPQPLLRLSCRRRHPLR